MALSSLLRDGLKTVQLESEQTKHGSILWLTLNRPQAYNAISMELLSDLHIILHALQHPTTMAVPIEDLPRVVIIRGAGGKAFCSGVDIKAADKGIGGQAWDYHDMRSQQLLARMIEKLRAIPQPVIAAIEGVASGGGCAIALAADVRIATQSSKLNTSFVRLGLSGTDMGTSFFLPRNVSVGVASELMMTGRMMTAQRAYQLGLLNEVVEDESRALEEAARNMAKDMLSCSPKGLQLTKEQMNAVADGMSLRATLTAENSHQIYLVNEPYAKEVAQQWLDAILSKSASSRSRL